MIRDLVARAAAEDTEAVDELERLAKADPVVLRPHLPEMLERGPLWPSVLFAGADEETVRRIIDRVDAGDERLGHLLLILSEVRGATAAAAFRRWQESPPPGLDELHLDALAYAREGGWDRRPAGTDHELYGPVAYELHMVDQSAAEDGSICPWCESPIWTVLDLDTADPDVARCPARALTMDYVGLVGGADLGWGEGADYVFVHTDCGIAAVTYQQS